MIVPSPLPDEAARGFFRRRSVTLGAYPNLMGDGHALIRGVELE